MTRRAQPLQTLSRLLWLLLFRSCLTFSLRFLEGERAATLSDAAALPKKPGLSISFTTSRTEDTSVPNSFPSACRDPCLALLRLLGGFI